MFMARSIAMASALEIEDSFGDVLTVLGFGRQQHNQLPFPVWIHLYRCGGDLKSCFGC